MLGGYRAEHCCQYFIRYNIDKMRALHWFRSDLRLSDNRALAAAAARAEEIALAFVLDPVLLSSPRTGAPRLRFLRGCLEDLAAELRRRGHRLLVRSGDPAVEIPRLLRETGARLLTLGRDYGPYAVRRDRRVAAAAERAGARVLAVKDRVIFESDEIRTRSGGPFRVYTPYRRAWERRLGEAPEDPGGPLRLPPPVRGAAAGALPSLASLGVADDPTLLPTPGARAARRRLARFVEHGLRDYAQRRDLPAEDGTSRLSPYLRLGVISMRSCLAAARAAAALDPACARGARSWISELVWREFYHAILAEHPRVLERSFRTEFDDLDWEQDPEGFAAWCDGRTGYPFVDAGMRQLRETGWMHNRARMVAASFLTKDLLVDWRAGERFFMQHLVDGDPASNNGGWQWAASTGTDAQPWFRIFNPVTQGERFDPDGRYVRRFVPELAGVPDRFLHRPWESPHPPRDYPPPCVDHAARRRLALERFASARRRGSRR
jgi:deoxyribodipyrimidine photo-lyase